MLQLLQVDLLDLLDLLDLVGQVSQVDLDLKDIMQKKNIKDVHNEVAI